MLSIADAAVGQRAQSASRAFEVVRSDPSDGQVIDDPKQALTVTFSAPVDQALLDRKNCLTVASNGNTVPGMFARNDAQVRFEPERPWTLSARYDVVLRPKLCDPAASTLEETRWSFSVRAGQWSHERRSDDKARRSLSRTPLSVSKSGQLASATSFVDGSTGKQSYQLERRLTGEDWQSVASGSAGPAEVVINDNGWVALASSEGFTAYDESQRQRYDVRRTGSVSPRVVLTESNELNMLDDRAGKLVHRAQFRETSPPDETVLTGEISPTGKVGFAPLTAIWYLAFDQTMSTQDGWTNSVWLTDMFAENTQITGAIKVSENPLVGPVMSGDRNKHSLIAIWMENNDAGGVAYASRRTEFDAVWREPVTIEGAEGADDLQLELDAMGNAIFMWVVGNQRMSFVMSSYYDASDDSWSTPVNVSGDATHYANRVALAVNASGQAVAAWTEAPATDNNFRPGVEYGARGSIFVPGLGWSEPVSLSELKDVTSVPAVGIADDGRAFASWVSDNEQWFGQYQ